MELTEREMEVVLRMRRTSAVHVARKQAKLEILRAAHEYEKWLQENGVGSTYSTFCDDFGYDGGVHVHRPGLFRGVCAARETADNYAGYSMSNLDVEHEAAQ